MDSPSELSLDCQSHSYYMPQKSFGEQADQTQKVEQFLARLEEERLKIDAFKRELPLCMQLLTNAMEASKQQLQTSLQINQGQRPVLEEFIPIKHSNSDGSENSSNISEKSSWMTSVQLWSQSNNETKQQTVISSPKLALDNKQRNGEGGGAFLPFSKDRNSNSRSTLFTDKEVNDDDKKYSEVENPAEVEEALTSTQRKSRRCWSLDLHQRFVNALQMLGGSQATPKQIRELMKVDGLTNDEVKSHLQKYRLHTRRPSPSPQVGTQAPQLVVLGGIWVSPEYATAATAHGAPPAIYGALPASHVSTQYSASPMPLDFYSPLPHQLHHSLHHPHQQRRHIDSSQNHSSPDSDIRSESNSWKRENDENGWEKNGLTS